MLIEGMLCKLVFGARRDLYRDILASESHQSKTDDHVKNDEYTFPNAVEWLQLLGTSCGFLIMFLIRFLNALRVY